MKVMFVSLQKFTLQTTFSTSFLKISKYQVKVKHQTISNVTNAISGLPSGSAVHYCEGRAEGCLQYVTANKIKVTITSSQRVIESK